MGRSAPRHKGLDLSGAAAHIAGMTKAKRFTIPKPDAPKPASGQPETAKPTDGEAEFGGPTGKDPTRYGDWEKNGRCSDF